MDVVEHQDFCAIGFSGQCTCASLPDRLLMYADKMQALHEAGLKADTKYRGVEIVAKIALVREAAAEILRLRSELDAAYESVATVADACAKESDIAARNFKVLLEAGDDDAAEHEIRHRGRESAFKELASYIRSLGDRDHG